MKNVYFLFFILVINIGSVDGADFEQTYDGKYHYENKVSSVSQTYTFRVKNVPNGYYHQVYVDGQFVEEKKETFTSNPTFSVYLGKGQIKKIEIQIRDGNWVYKASHEWYFKESPPKLCLNKGIKNFGEVELGNNPSIRTFTFSLENCGAGTLKGDISGDNWLSFSTTSFSLSQNSGKQITVTANTSELPVGDYSANISVTTNGGSQSWNAVNVQIVKMKGDLKILVKDTNGSPQENAKVILYENISNNWQEISEKKYTNLSGETGYWELPAGKYNAEVYNDGGGGSEFWTSAWNNNGVISLNAGETKTYSLQRNEPYAYNYKVFDSNTGEELTGKEIPVGSLITHRIFVTNKSSVDREVKVKVCLNKNKSTDWNYSSSSVVISSNSTLSFDFKQTVGEAGTYYRKIKVETLVHNYTQTDWWDWGTSIIGKDNVVASINIDPISAVTKGVQFKVTCNITNNGSSARTFNVGAEIKDGETKLKTLPVWTSPTVAIGQTTQTSYYITIPDNWEAKEYTFNAAVWNGTPGSGEWLAGDDVTFSVNNPNSAQIIEFTPPRGVFDRGTETTCTVKVKNTGTTTCSFWVGLSYANEEATNADWPVLWYDVKPKETSLLAPGDEQIMNFTYIIPTNFRPGNYYASAAIWEDFDEERWLMSEPRFDDTRNYDIWKSKETGKLAFTLFGYDSSNKSDIIKQLKYMVKESVCEDKSIEDMYYDLDNSSKPLLYFGLSTPNVLFGELCSVGSTVLIDLADLFEITPEGKDGFVTVWVDGSVNFGVGVSLPVSLGIVKQDFDYNERAIADIREDAKIGAFGASFPVWAITGVEFVDNGDMKIAKIDHPVTIGASLSLVKLTQEGIVSKEVNKIDVIDAITSAFSEENTIETCLNLLTNKFYAWENFVIPNTRQTTWDDGSWELSDGTWESNLKLSKQYDSANSKKNYAHQFYINVPENVNKLNIHTTGNTGNSDLFVKYGGRPDLDGPPYNVYNSPDNEENITIDNPNPGKYYIMLPSTEPYERVSLNASFTINESFKELSVAPDSSWDYGDVTTNYSSDKTFILQNTGSTTLNVSTIKISGVNIDQYEIISPSSTNFDIPAKSSVDVKVRFTPTSFGTKSAQLEISNNSDNASPIKTISLGGAGTDILTKTFVVTPENSWDYGNVTVDNGNDKIFIFQNTGSADIIISNIEISGTNNDQFEIISPTSTNFNIAAKSSVEVKVRFTPTSFGTKSAQLEISNNSDNASPIKTISLGGAGTDILTKTFVITPENSWDYGNVTVDNGNDKIFIFQNTGSADFIISNIEISGTNNDQFEIVSPTSTNFNIAAKSSVEVKVRFNPTSFGAKSAQLEISNNSDNASPTITISLWGTGTDVLTKTLVVTPKNSWDYGDVTVNKSSDKTFLLQNTGSADLNISNIKIRGTNSDQFEIVSPTSTNFDIAAKSSAEMKIRFSPTSLGGKSAQMEIYNNSDNTSPIQTISLYGNGTSVNVTNVARSINGGIASAISDGTYSGVKHYASFSNDGDNTSAWTSQWSMPAWLKVKFNKSYLINKVGVIWGTGTHNQDYSISLSVDGNSWSTVVQNRSSNTDAGYTENTYHGSENESHEVFDITPTNAQYIKIDITKTSAPSSHIFQAIVHELEAYATNNNPATFVNVQEQSKVQIYPNPTTGSIQIEGLPESSSTNLLIYNLQGQLVIQKIVSASQASIDISKQVAGTYLLVINNDHSQTIKIIKE